MGAGVRHFPLLGSLLGMLIARIVLGVAEGPLFSLKNALYQRQLRR